MAVEMCCVYESAHYQNEIGPDGKVVMVHDPKDPTGKHLIPKEVCYTRADGYFRSLTDLTRHNEPGAPLKFGKLGQAAPGGVQVVQAPVPDALNVDKMGEKMLRALADEEEIDLAKCKTVDDVRAAVKKALAGKAA